MKARKGRKRKKGRKEEEGKHTYKLNVGSLLWFVFLLFRQMNWVWFSVVAKLLGAGNSYKIWKSQNLTCTCTTYESNSWLPVHPWVIWEMGSWIIQEHCLINVKFKKSVWLVWPTDHIPDFQSTHEISGKWVSESCKDTVWLTNFKSTHETSGKWVSESCKNTVHQKRRKATSPFTGDSQLYM